MRRRHGFTFIELTAVLAIIAMIAALAAAVSLRSMGRRAQMAEVVQQLAHADQVMRQYARRFDRPCQMLLDLQGQKATRLDAQTQRPHGQTYELPRGFAIRKLMLPGVQTEAGSLTMPCSAAGYTPTYAILLSGPPPQRQNQWLLFIGLTGQVLEIEHEKDIIELFDKTLRPTSSRSAMTLVEVLAGLALLSTLLASLLVAKGQHTRQWALAQRRLEATRAADTLLRLWWQDVKNFPRADDGSVDGHLNWRTEVTGNEEVERLGAEAVRLEIFDPRLPPSEQVLASVEVVLRQQEPELERQNAKTTTK